MFSIDVIEKNESQKLYQWDVNRYIRIEVPEGARVEIAEFAHERDKQALGMEIVEENGIRMSKIPNKLLQSSWPIKVWLRIDGQTVFADLLVPLPKAKPPDYILPDDEDEVLCYRTLEKRIEALEKNSCAGATDAVRYVEQELTKEQQNRARKNIGAASSEEVDKLSGGVDSKKDKDVIVAITKTTVDDNTTYSADKTFEEIEKAISEGKEVKAKFNATYYRMAQHNVGKTVWFQCSSPNIQNSPASIISYLIKHDDTVALYHSPVQETKNMVEALSADSTNSQYPSAKAVVDYVDGYSAINKNLLIVNVDTETKTADKTAKEIYESAQSGIPCVCMYYDTPFVYSQGVNMHLEDYGYALFNYPRDDNNQLKIDCQGKVTVRNTELYSKEATEDQRGLVRLGRGFKKPDYPDVDKYLVDNVICPESAEVGQIVRITAVDENGVPTAVEAIDAPEQEDPEQIAELVFLNYIDAIDDINGETVYGTEQLQEDLDEINGEEV